MNKPTKLTEADVTLELLAEGRTVQVGRANSRRSVTLKSYKVLDPNGVLLGVVRHDMATFERRSKGKMFVNSRWQSPRWFYEIDHRRSRVFFETRKQAVEELLRSVALRGAGINNASRANIGA